MCEVKKKVSIIIQEPAFIGNTCSYIQLTNLSKFLKNHFIINIIYIYDKFSFEKKEEIKRFCEKYEITLDNLEINHNFDISLKKKISFQLFNYLQNLSDVDFVISELYSGILFYSLKAKKSGLCFQKTRFFTVNFEDFYKKKQFNKEMVSELYEIEQVFMENQCRIESDKYYKYKISTDDFKIGENEINLVENIYISMVDDENLIASIIKENSDKKIFINSEKIEELSNTFKDNDNIVYFNDDKETFKKRIDNNPSSLLVTEEKINVKFKTLYDNFYTIRINDGIYELFFRNKLLHKSNSFLTIWHIVNFNLLNLQETIFKKIKDDVSIPNGCNTNFKDTQELPKVSVCITHYNRPKYLSIVLESLKKQTYKNFEIIIVDDGSKQPDALEYLKQLEGSLQEHNLRVLYKENNYLGAARNYAAKHSEGKYILFMDDDNAALPEMIEYYVKAAEFSNMPIITCVLQKFSREPAPKSKDDIIGYYLPLGSCLPLGALENCFGDANALIKREVFEEIGGFSEDYGIGYEDWEFFAKASLKGYEILPLPYSLVWYRVNPNSMVNTTNLYLNHQRVFRTYNDYLPADMQLLLEMTFVKTFTSSFSENNYFLFHKILNRFFPPNSKRRQFAKKILYKLFSNA